MPAQPGTPSSPKRARGESESPPPPHSGVSKRRRTALACATCRTRKSRCDGKRPTCSACEEMSFVCTYAQSSTSSNVIVGKDYLSRLEARLQSVEDTLGSVQGQLQALQGGAARPVPGDAPPSSRPSQNGNGPILLQDLGDETERIDAMGAVVFSNEEESGFFGPSSNVAFLRHISQAAAEATSVSFLSPGHDTALAVMHGGLVSFSRPSSPHGDVDAYQPDKVNIYEIPPDAQVTEMLQRFFSYPGYLYPYIHEDRFMATYAQLKSSPRPTVRRSWLGLFNMVLAMAVSTHLTVGVDATQRAEQSEVFYQRAVGLCGKQSMRGTSIDIVHYLLLTGLYLQGTQKSIEAWVVHGLAVKAAMQLGLHSSEASRGLSALDGEIRKRTWYGCVVLDRSLSMTFGRPSAIPDPYVRLALPDETPFYPATAAHKSSASEATCPLNVRFFALTIQLYQILWRVVDQLYGQNIGCDRLPQTSDTVTRLFALEGQLQDWEQRLPEPLQPISHYDLVLQAGQADFDNAANIRQRQTRMLRIILTLRYLNIRLLLHRAILIKFLDARSPAKKDAAEFKMLHQIGAHSIQVCMQTATEIVSIVHSVITAFGPQRKLLGAWWYTLYFTFNAALVIFACFFICRPSGGVGAPLPIVTVDEAMEALTRAIQALEMLDKGNLMADRCHHYLQLLVNVLQAIDCQPADSKDAVPDAMITGAHVPFPYTINGNEFGLEEPSLGMDVGGFFGLNFNF